MYQRVYHKVYQTVIKSDKITIGTDKLKMTSKDVSVSKIALTLWYNKKDCRKTAF